jgi:hypothetical protein
MPDRLYRLWMRRLQLFLASRPIPPTANEPAQAR